MIAILTFILSNFAMAQTCNIENLDMEPKVKVYYQSVVQAGDTYAKPLVTELLTFSGTVDPRKVDMDSLKISRPHEKVVLSAEVPVVDGVIPNSIKFVTDAASIQGRIEGAPTVTFDENRNIATVHLTMKYKDGKFDKQTVGASGVVTYLANTTATQIVQLPETYIYDGTLSFNSGKIEPKPSDIEKIKIGKLNQPDRIIVRELNSNCVWFAGDVANSNKILRTFLPDNGVSQVSLKGKPLEVLPYISDSELIIEVKEE